MKFVGYKHVGDVRKPQTNNPNTDDVYMVIADEEVGAVPFRPYDFVRWDGTKWARVDSKLVADLEIPGGDIGELIPSDTTEDNPLVNESYVKDKDKVIAAALNDLNARVAAIESVAADNNIGSVIADSIDTQKLLVGGSDLEARVAAIEAILANNNLRTAAAPAPSFTKSVPVDNIDLQVEVDKTEETKKTFEDNIMEEK